MSNIDEKAKNNFTIEMRIFENYEKVKHEIIKAIEYLLSNGKLHTIKGIQWVEIPLSLVFDNRLFGWFPPYKKYIPHRIKVLKLALKDLERIKYGKD